ncbi:MAG TPA: amino acid permease [Bryobacteraceae bacterium]|nr:amino acid permease [Bryobacteraceae bacterium]
MSDSSRRLRLIDASAIVAGSMIGSGIFLAPALIADIVVQARLGAGTFLAIWIVGGLLTVCGALSFGELAAAMPATGGQYVYLREAFSPLWGFLYGWTLFTIIQCGFIAAVSLAFANYLGVFLPFISAQQLVFHAGPISLSTVQLGAVALIVFLTWLNQRGLRSAALTQNLLTAGKITALLILLAVALFSTKGNWNHLQPLAPAAISTAALAAFSVAMSKALFGYDSWNIVTFLAGETRDPVRTLPRALALGTLAVTAIYTLANLAYIYILPLPAAAAVQGQRIAAAIAQMTIGSAGLLFIAGAIVISTSGCVNGLILTGPWLYLSMARDGLFFRAMARMDGTHGIPKRSLQYQSLWAIVLVLSGSLGSRGARLYSDLLTFTSFASLLFNTLTIAGLFVLRRRRPDLPRPYKAFGYPLVPLLYLVIAAFLLVFIAVGDPGNAGIGAVLIAAGVPFYWYWKARRT